MKERNKEKIQKQETNFRTKLAVVWRWQKYVRFRFLSSAATITTTTTTTTTPPNLTRTKFQSSLLF